MCTVSFVYFIVYLPLQWHDVHRAIEAKAKSRTFPVQLSPQSTHFLSLLLITSAHLASLPVALPHCRHLATGSGVGLEPSQTLCFGLSFAL